MPMTEAQKKAASERLAKAREAKKAKQAASTPAPDQNNTMPSNAEYQDLLRQVNELKELIASNQVSLNPPKTAEELGRTMLPTQPQYGANGRMVGTFEKYIIDPLNYPDPTPRLAQEPRLARFAFPINYELDFTVTTTQYQTLDGVNTREPKFTLELIHIVRDEDTGEPTDGRYVLRTAVFHEDPQAALTVAREQGLEVPDDPSHEKAFLDEMRYIRMRDWLLEAFYPPKSTVTKKKKDMVIGNKVVEYYEVNSESSAGIPFGELKSKL